MIIVGTILGTTEVAQTIGTYKIEGNRMLLYSCTHEFMLVNIPHMMNEITLKALTSRQQNFHLQNLKKKKKKKV